MKNINRINENQKITLTFGQLKRLIKESYAADDFDDGSANDEEVYDPLEKDLDDMENWSDQRWKDQFGDISSTNDLNEGDILVTRMNVHPLFFKVLKKIGKDRVRLIQVQAKLMDGSSLKLEKWVPNENKELYEPLIGIWDHKKIRVPKNKKHDLVYLKMWDGRPILVYPLI